MSKYTQEALEAMAAEVCAKHGIKSCYVTSDGNVYLPANKGDMNYHLIHTDGVTGFEYKVPVPEAKTEAKESAEPKDSEATTGASETKPDTTTPPSGDDVAKIEEAAAAATADADKKSKKKADKPADQ